MLIHLFTTLVSPSPAQASPAPAATDTAPASSWIDLDVDGRDDLVLQLPGRGLLLFRHLADGGFEDVTERVGVDLLTDIHQASWADVDRDGDPDLLVVRTSGALALLCNEGLASFRRVEAGSGLEEERVLSSSWHDFDRDGLPDLLLESTDDVELWHNLGDCRFASMLAAREASPVPGPPAFENVHRSVGGVLAGADAGPIGENGSPSGPAGSSGTTDVRPSGPAGGLVVRPEPRRRSPASGVPQRVATPSPPGALELQAAPVCVDALEDQSSGACLQADSTPTAGRLFPLGPLFHIDAVTGHVGMGTLTPGYALEVTGQILSGTGNSAGGAESAVGGGKMNTASGPQATIAGGESNLATGVGATVGGGLSNLAVSDQATIGGGVDNSAGYRAFVGGGQTNDADFAHATVAGGKQNVAGGPFASVVGGGGNQAAADHGFVGGGAGNNASGAQSAIVGGLGNTASGLQSFVGGGDDNRATGDYSVVAGGGGGVPNSAGGRASVIGGGQGNQIETDRSTIAGGVDNWILASLDYTGVDDHSTIGGGNGNWILDEAQFSTIGGGSNNAIASPPAGLGGPVGSYYATIGGGRSNWVGGNYGTVGGGQGNGTGDFGTVAGGFQNTASGTKAAVGGGASNDASGEGATIPGGEGNEASGDHSFAAGRGADALHDDSFVWSAGSGTFASTASGQFLIDAYGGVGIGTDAPPAGALEVAGAVRSSGASGGALIAFNPNNASASAKLDWFADQARLRIGGSGAGSQSGLDIQTTGDVSLMRIGHDGRVGIGTTSPAEDLHVVGDVRMGTQGGGDGASERLAIDGLFGTWSVGTFNSGPGNFYIGSTEETSADFQITPDGKVGIQTGSTISFDLEVNGTAGKPGGGSWSALSDRRLKTNVADLEGALETLLALRGVTFEYRDPEAIGELPGTRTGFIAQEVEVVLPDWVGEREDGYKTLTIRGFEALAVEALRELARENAELRGRLERLEGVTVQGAEGGARLTSR